MTRNEEVREAIAKYVKVIEENNTITLSTVSPEGNLWSTKTYYGEDNGYLYICIENVGRAFNNMKKNPRIFFVIEHNDPMRFVQGEGIVEIIGPSEEHPLERSYYLRKNFPAVGFLRMVQTTVIRIRPTRVFVSDFTEGWKPRTEIVFDEEKFKILQSFYQKPKKWKWYIQATRPWVIGITIAAVFIGAFIAMAEGVKINIWTFLLTLLGATFVHLGVNAWSDYFDWKKGADRWYTLGSSRTIVDGLMKPSTVLGIGALLIVLALICGLALAFTLPDPRPLLYLMIAGGALGLFYAFVPIGWKYIALGDVAVFLAWSLICVGSYFIQAHKISWQPFWAFLPVALLVVGILHGNNMRDIGDDIKAGYRTLAGVLGLKGSQIYYTIIMVGAYASLIFAVAKGYLPWWCLIALLTVPYAWRNIKWAFRPNYLQFNMLDYYTAMLSNRFAMLMMGGLVAYLLGIG